MRDNDIYKNVKKKKKMEKLAHIGIFKLQKELANDSIIFPYQISKYHVLQVEMRVLNFLW